jgi:Tfp pilus assembly protein PilV
MRKQKALTLIEVVIAVTILMAVSASLISIFSQGARYTRKSVLSTTALFLAQEALENATYASTTQAAVPVVVNDAQFTLAFTATAAGTNLKQFNATVSWPGEKGTQSVTLMTFRTNY